MRRLNESRGQIMICPLLSVGASTKSKFRTLEKLSSIIKTRGYLKLDNLLLNTDITKYNFALLSNRHYKSA